MFLEATIGNNRAAAADELCWYRKAQHIVDSNSGIYKLEFCSEQQRTFVADKRIPSKWNELFKRQQQQQLSASNPGTFISNRGSSKWKWSQISRFRRVGAKSGSILVFIRSQWRQWQRCSNCKRHLFNSETSNTMWWSCWTQFSTNSNIISSAKEHRFCTHFLECLLLAFVNFVDGEICN